MICRDTEYAITHAMVVTPEAVLPNATIVVRQGLILDVGTFDTSLLQDLVVFDAKGTLVGPGLIDIHIHGAGGFTSTKENLQENLEKLASFLAEKGITAFQLAVVMDMDLLIAIKEAWDNSLILASHLLGVYVEGPFIAPHKKGGIPSTCIHNYHRGYLSEILAIRHGGKPVVTTMTIAPELRGSEELTEILEDHGVVVAYGHSDCSLTTLQPRKRNHITHLFNAMSPISHKRPGLAAMPFTRDFSHATYELVCDGVHVNSSVVDLTINTLGPSRLCLISDAIHLAGLGVGNGVYIGKEIYSNGRACYYSDNDLLIGSAMLINESAKSLYQRGSLNRHSFFKVASENPAEVLSLSNRGKIAPGYKADLIMLSNQMDIVQVFKSK
ncbi:MAG: amidohydrolase family protein [Sphaerochaetaceae bacterium]|nr:amidohydrolase family protein [Sphaerochaetaceae bacterium]